MVSPLTLCNIARFSSIGKKISVIRFNIESLHVMTNELTSALPSLQHLESAKAR